MVFGWFVFGSCLVIVWFCDLLRVCYGVVRVVFFVGHCLFLGWLLFGPCLVLGWLYIGSWLVIDWLLIC